MIDKVVKQHFTHGSSGKCCKTTPGYYCLDLAVKIYMFSSSPEKKKWNKVKKSSKIGQD